MKRAVLIAFIIGLGLGAGQFFVVWHKTVTPEPELIADFPPGSAVCQAITPECGDCPATRQGNMCVYDSFTQKVKGFPLTSAQYEKRSDNASHLFKNLLIFTVGLPLLAVLGSKLTKK